MTTYTLDIRTVTPHFPGIGRYVRNLALHMTPLLADTETLVMLSNASQTSFLAELETVSERVVVREISASPFSLRQQRQVPATLRSIARSIGGAQVYHSPYVLMPYRVPCPSIVTVYDLIALKYPLSVSLQARVVLPLAIRLALRSSRRIITISEATRNDLLAAYQVEPSKIATIYLAADERYWPRSEAEQAEVRARYGLLRPYFLYVGINKPHKNLERLVRAYAQLRNVSTDTEQLPVLAIAGAWDDRYGDIQQQVEKLGLGESIKFLGRIEEELLPALYSAATAFIFPSLYEGFGLPILEAMACGTPVACGHNSSLPEVAGDAAFYFDAEDTGSITMALHVLSEQEGIRRTMAQKGQEQVRKFSWRRTADETLAQYRSLNPN